MARPEYRVLPLDLHDARLLEAATTLVNGTFAGYRLAGKKLLLNTQTRNGRTLYLGAYIGGELAAVNFFIAHELMHDGANAMGYQSCWSATSPDHQKKGLFSLLINTAKDLLKERGAAFIFGYPNVNSEPIFLKKLGFRSLPMAKVNIPVALFPRLSMARHLKSLRPGYVLPVSDCYIPQESEIIDLKEGEYGVDIRVYEAYNNVVWGRKVRRRSPLGAVTFFNVGGLQVNKPHLLHHVFSRLVREERPAFLQIVGVRRNTLWELFRGVRPAPGTEPLIVFDLNADTTHSHFNFITGIKDVF